MHDATRLATATQPRHNGAAMGELLDSLPPHDLAAERGVLCSILIDPERFGAVAGELASVDFYLLQHRRIYDAMVSIHAAGAVIDATLLASELSRHDAPEGCRDWHDVLLPIARAEPHPENAVEYARIVRQHAVARRLGHAAMETYRRIANGESPDDVTALLREVIDASGESRRRELPCIGSRELAETVYDQRYLVDGILPAGQPGMIVGRFKSMKTSVAIDLAVSMATATPYLGAYDVPEACRVGVVSGESGWPTIQETATRISSAKGIPLADIADDMLRWSTTLPPFDTLAGAMALERWIDRHTMQCVLLDPCYLGMSSVADKASNVFAMGAALRPLSEIGQRTGCSITLIHHAVKHRIQGKEYAPPDLSDASQSGFAEFARWWLLLARREEYADGSGDHRLWLRAGGSAGHSGLYAVDIAEGATRPRGWSVSISTAATAREGAEQAKENAKTAKQEAADGRAVDRLWDVVQRYSEGETEKVLREGAGLRPDGMRAAMRLLLADGRIGPAPITRANGHTYDGWKPLP